MEVIEGPLKKGSESGEGVACDVLGVWLLRAEVGQLAGFGANFLVMQPVGVDKCLPFETDIGQDF